MRSLRFMIVANMLACSLLSGCAALGFPPKGKSESGASEEVKHHQEMVHVFDQKRDAAQFQAALSRWQQRDAKGCRELVQQLLNRSPKHREARMLRAELYLVEEKPQAALEDIKQLASEKPDDAEVEHLLGLLLEAVDQKEVALAHFKRAAEIDPKNEVFAVSYLTASESETTPQRKTPSTERLATLPAD